MDFVKFKYLPMISFVMQRGVMTRKAQGLPITTIIIAILGIAVLVILFAILTGRLTIFSAVVSECPGVCGTLDLKAASVKQGVLAARESCEEDERQLFGTYIARVRAPDATGKLTKAVPCNVCCISAV